MRSSLRVLIVSALAGAMLLQAAPVPVMPSQASSDAASFAPRDLTHTVHDSISTLRKRLETQLDIRTLLPKLSEGLGDVANLANEAEHAAPDRTPFRLADDEASTSSQATISPASQHPGQTHTNSAAATLSPTRDESAVQETDRKRKRPMFDLNLLPPHELDDVEAARALDFQPPQRAYRGITIDPERSATRLRRLSAATPAATNSHDGKGKGKVTEALGISLTSSERHGTPGASSSQPQGSHAEADTSRVQNSPGPPIVQSPSMPMSRAILVQVARIDGIRQARARRPRWDLEELRQRMREREVLRQRQREAHIELNGQVINPPPPQPHPTPTFVRLRRANTRDFPRAASGVVQAGESARERRIARQQLQQQRHAALHAPDIDEEPEVVDPAAG